MNSADIEIEVRNHYMFVCMEVIRRLWTQIFVLLCVVAQCSNKYYLDERFPFENLSFSDGIKEFKLGISNDLNFVTQLPVWIRHLELSLFKDILFSN